MAVSRCGLALLASLGSLASGLVQAGPVAASPPAVSAAPVRAVDAPMCRLINLGFTPGGLPAGQRAIPDTKPPRFIASPEIQPQIVAWIETPAGEYVDTVYITQQTGRYGIGNRPGRFDFNSGPNWPYGRRITVFPVWAHKNGKEFPQITFRNSDDNGLSHPFNESSTELHFWRPVQTSEEAWDAVTFGSTVYTDKGDMRAGAGTTGYPPRADVTPTGQDAPSVAMYRAMNPFDAISQATPRLGVKTAVSWPIPRALAAGAYVMLFEVSLEQDFNATYDSTRYPSPTKQQIAYSEYGVAYRGQPSVLYKVPFTITTEGETVATTDSYIGYGDPDGLDGAIRDPDATITSDTPNSGALRLLLTADQNGEMYRARVEVRVENDTMAPGAPGNMFVTDPEASRATLAFSAPGDDGMVGAVQGYEVRYRAGHEPITEETFALANVVPFEGDVVAAGEEQTVTLKNLLPETEYTVAIRAFDNCSNTSTVSSTTFTTAARKVGEVDACFVATAAYGSLLANDVEMLRRFRDTLLKHSVLGELAVETYYTFGPTVAGVVGESDLLRSTARDLLAPIVSRVRALRW